MTDIDLSPEAVRVVAGRLLDGREWNEMPGVRHG
jgi:hypothetical protein